MLARAACTGPCRAVTNDTVATGDAAIQRTTPIFGQVRTDVDDMPRFRLDGADRMSKAMRSWSIAVTPLLWWAPFPGSANEPPAVRTRTFELEYRANAEALPLESVQLWYTRDRGDTWTAFGLDEDRQSPFTFTANHEGVHGFYVVLTNRSGASGAAPSAGTSPQAWAFIDFTPPIVQLHPSQSTLILGRRVVQVRWTAADSNFGPRPIELAYRRETDAAWTPLSNEPLANTARFDWRVPEGLSGAVTIQLIATDLGGNRVSADPHTMELIAVSFDDGGKSPGAFSGPASLETQTEIALHGSARAKEHAARLFAEAVSCRERGELREAAARLREVVRLDPQSIDAFVEMGDVLYRLGDLDRALNAYELGLRRQPMLRTALRGAAAVHGQKRDYVSAAGLLRSILRHNPQDAEVWMNLGDIAVYQGDEVLAREAYTRSLQADPNAAQVIADANKRLELLESSSRTYRPTKR